MMKTAPYFVTALVVILLLWYVTTPMRRGYEIEHLEKNARKVITASKLQEWAVSLLRSADSSPGSGKGPQMNFPPQLLKLYHKPPSVEIHESTSLDHSYVTVIWGGALAGDCGFFIGTTNYLWGNGHKWQDGVFFWSENPQK
jgi:hypothetical protein